MCVVITSLYLSSFFAVAAAVMTKKISPNPSRSIRWCVPILRILVTLKLSPKLKPTLTHIRTIIVLFMLNAVVLFVASLPRFVFVTPLHLIWSAIYLCTFFSSGGKYRYKMKCAPVIIIIIIVIKYTRFKSNSANRSYVNGWTYAMLMWSLAVANICYCSLLCIRFYWFCLIILTELEYTKRRNNNNHIQSAGIFFVNCDSRTHTHSLSKCACHIRIRLTSSRMDGRTDIK